MLDLFYSAIALESFLLSLAAVPLARRLGMRWGLVDRPGGRKIHTHPIARCGGLGVFAAFALCLVLDLALLRVEAVQRLIPAALAPYLPNVSYVAPKLGALFAGASLMMLTGLADDKYDLRPGLKLSLQILAALPLVFAGVTVKAFLPFPILGALLTIAWIVLLTNSFNFLDNMNGLSSGIAAIALINFYLIMRINEQFFMMAICAALVGALIGFLRYNFPRAHVFLGDSGSLFVGYMIAGISIMITYYDVGVPSRLPIIAPLLVLGVPLFDTISVIYIRWRNGAPLMQGDRNHFSHRLVALGFTPTQAVMLIWLLAIGVGIAAVNLRWLPTTGAIFTLVQAVAFFLIIYLLERTAQKKIGQ
ncbi:MAG: undecaprenyl/decaprenyl-phosphate alpha-N-acetylglucosaminyl 1-phosphate transferase [Candidatus Sumerlaeaceae bacterium]|nr:undecaprenyl/decaprenyl-phosphate alpha-N-acetylglucosaminyl 1-phosphate transferase [Candidatus Sumerlaeaceae bacterium]